MEDEGDFRRLYQWLIERYQLSPKAASEILFHILCILEQTLPERPGKKKEEPL